MTLHTPATESSFAVKSYLTRLHLSGPLTLYFGSDQAAPDRRHLLVRHIRANHVRGHWASSIQLRRCWADRMGVQAVPSISQRESADIVRKDLLNGRQSMTLSQQITFLDITVNLELALHEAVKSVPVTRSTHDHRYRLRKRSRERKRIRARADELRAELGAKS